MRCRLASPLLLAVVLLLATGIVQGATPSESELQAARAWIATHLEANAAPPRFFSFTYGDQKSEELLPQWKFERSEPKTDGHRTRYTLSWTDAASGLVVRCEATQWDDYPAVEWVLYFKNTGTADTPILENILPLDSSLPLAQKKQSVRLHYANGSQCRLDDFQPQVAALGPTDEEPQGRWREEKNPLRIGSEGGRSSCGALPFFNLDFAERGVIGAVGWSGDWSASFFRNAQAMWMQAGMRQTHFKLLPGEEVRSPRILLLFWEGDRLHGHNLLRSFLLAYHTPTQDGQRVKTPVCQATWGGDFAANHIEHGRWWKKHQLPLDYLWIDAGWFGRDEAKEGANVFNSHWGDFVGDWQPNPGYFPEGLKPVSTALQQANMRLLMWLEPERVYQGTLWTREHPEFLLGPEGRNYLFDLGNPAACRFLTDFLGRFIEEHQVGCYRQDFNMDPRPFWDKNDVPDRVGISEIRHITGMYALWDELLRRFPDLLIDNCASGGRRIDLETISRSIPLWRSDYQCYPNYSATGMQGQTHGLGLWVPLSTGCCDREDTYLFRSSLGPGLVLGIPELGSDSIKPASIEWLRARLLELQAVRPCFEGDFYPLLSFSLADDAWAAWQFDRPDAGEGMVLAFRRPESPLGRMTAKLHGLIPDAVYELRCVDGGEAQRRSGRQWMEEGLDVSIDQHPGSKLFVYRKVEKRG